jgi:NADH:ubiquinone oxidoreductase subunit 3 (subunit A)
MINYLSFDVETQSLLPAIQQITEINIAWFVAIFFFMSAFAHLFISTVYRKKYEKNLLFGINKEG